MVSLNVSAAEFRGNPYEVALYQNVGRGFNKYLVLAENSADCVADRTVTTGGGADRHRLRVLTAPRRR